MRANMAKNKMFRQFIKFCLVGFGNTLIDYAVYIFFSRYLGWYFLYANIMAILVALTFSFFINKYWTFNNNENKLPSQYLKFFLVSAVYFVLNNSIVFVLVKYLAVFDLAAKVIAIIIGLFWNFFAHKYWTFKVKGQ